TGTVVAVEICVAGVAKAVSLVGVGGFVGSGFGVFVVGEGADSTLATTLASGVGVAVGNGVRVAEGAISVGVGAIPVAWVAAVAVGGASVGVGSGAGSFVGSGFGSSFVG
ncbi:MAG: hypothetical protein QGE95_15455, partial [Arenicellales bacterium]|nr:hypothetical protein [Arenicellales bacterium]